MDYGIAVVGLAIGHFRAVGLIQQLHAGVQYRITRKGHGVVVARALAGRAVSGNFNGNALAYIQNVCGSGRSEVPGRCYGVVRCKGVPFSSRCGIGFGRFAGLVVVRDGYDVKVAVFKCGCAVAPCYAGAFKVHDVDGGNVCEFVGARLAVGAQCQTAGAYQHDGVGTVVFFKPQHPDGRCSRDTGGQRERSLSVRSILSSTQRFTCYRLHVLVQHHIGRVACATGDADVDLVAVGRVLRRRNCWADGEVDCARAIVVVGIVVSMCQQSAGVRRAATVEDFRVRFLV